MMSTNTIRPEALSFSGLSMAALVARSAGANTVKSMTDTSVTTAMISNSGRGALYLVDASNPNGDWVVPPADYILPNMNVNAVATSKNQNDFPHRAHVPLRRRWGVCLQCYQLEDQGGCRRYVRPDSHDVTVTMTSGYPAMNVTYVLR
ncbi:hypothetical protein ACETU7_31465 [Rhodococcus sp. 3Y1]